MVFVAYLNKNFNFLKIYKQKYNNVMIYIHISEINLHNKIIEKKIHI